MRLSAADEKSGVDVALHDKRDAVLEARIVDRNHMGRRHPCRQMRLAEDAADRLGWKRLDQKRRAQHRVAGEVSHTHATRTQLAMHGQASKRLARRQANVGELRSEGDGGLNGEKIRVLRRAPGVIRDRF